MSEVGGRNARRKAQRVGLARARANAATDVLKKFSRGLCTVNYERLAGCELSARPSSLNSLETPCNAGTACRTDSEDAFLTKNRGLMLRSPKHRQAPGRRKRPSLQRNETPPTRGEEGLLGRGRPDLDLHWHHTASHVKSASADTAEGVNSCKRRSDNALNELQQR